MLFRSSGMPFRSAQEVPVLDRLSLADRVRSYAMTPLDFVPESRYQYSNAGINTAARIVEVVSGLPFEQFLAERLLQPLGMLAEETYCSGSASGDVVVVVGSMLAAVGAAQGEDQVPGMGGHRCEDAGLRGVHGDSAA